MEQKPESVGRLPHLAGTSSSLVGLSLPNAPPPAPLGERLAAAPADPTAAAHAHGGRRARCPEQSFGPVGPAVLFLKALPSLAPLSPPADPEPVREALRQAKESLWSAGTLTKSRGSWRAPGFC